jgi:hypothetical protein
MKSLILAVVALAFVLFAAGSNSVSAKPLTKEEREAAVKYLKQTQKLFLDSVKGLSEEQLKWKPAPDKWSVFEVSEHITLAESFIFDMIAGQVMKSPADETKTSAVTAEQIMKMVPDRSQKFQAPEPIRPDKATWSSMTETLAAFKQKRGTTINFVDKGNDDMRSHFCPNPIFKDLDAYLWLFFLSGHTERHVKQILEVKANPGFPRK